MKSIILFILFVGATIYDCSAHYPKPTEARKATDSKITLLKQGEQLYNKAMEDLALKITTDLLAAGKKRVAVVNFLNTRNETTELGKYLAEEYSTILFNKKLSVVDRGQLETLMNENKIGGKGILNPAEVTKLGKLAGIQVVITGTMTLFDKQLKLAIKGIDVEQGVIVAAAVGNIPRTEAIDQLYESETRGNNEGGSSGSGTGVAANTCKPVKDCKKLSLGGVCITNKSARDIEVHIWGQGGEKFLIHPGKTEGVNQYPIKEDYQKIRIDIKGEGRRREIKTLLVEACKVENVIVN